MQRREKKKYKNKKKKRKQRKKQLLLKSKREEKLIIQKHGALNLIRRKCITKTLKIICGSGSEKQTKRSWQIQRFFKTTSTERNLIKVLLLKLQTVVSQMDLIRTQMLFLLVLFHMRLRGTKI